MNYTIEIKNVGKKYRNNFVLKDISLSIKPGEIYGLIGSNGCGKTTLLKIISGLIRFDQGQVNVLGVKYDGRTLVTPQGIGIVTEQSAFIPHLSGRKNLQLLASIRGITTEEKILDCLRMVGLNPDDKKQVRQYSLGMRQRLGLAQAMMEEPKLLLLDEPTNGLDPIGIIEIRKLVVDLARKQGVAVLITSHLLQEIEKMCDRIGIIRDGILIRELDFQKTDSVVNSRSIEIKLSTEEDLENLIRWKGAEELYRLPTDDICATFQVRTSMPELIRELVAEGISIESIQPAKLSLEDLYMNIAATKEGGDQ